MNRPGFAGGLVVESYAAICRSSLVVGCLCFGWRDVADGREQAAVGWTNRPTLPQLPFSRFRAFSLSVISVGTPARLPDQPRPS